MGKHQIKLKMLLIFLCIRFGLDWLLFGSRHVSNVIFINFITENIFYTRITIIQRAAHPDGCGQRYIIFPQWNLPKKPHVVITIAFMYEYMRSIDARLFRASRTINNQIHLARNI